MTSWGKQAVTSEGLLSMIEPDQLWHYRFKQSYDTQPIAEHRQSQDGPGPGFASDILTTGGLPRNGSADVTVRPESFRAF